MSGCPNTTFTLLIPAFTHSRIQFVFFELWSRSRTCGACRGVGRSRSRKALPQVGCGNTGSSAEGLSTIVPSLSIAFMPREVARRIASTVASAWSSVCPIRIME